MYKSVHEPILSSKQVTFESKLTLSAQKWVRRCKEQQNFGGLFLVVVTV